jgi:hypothetical protein
LKVINNYSEELTTSVETFITLKMAAVSSFETLVDLYQTTQRYIPEDSELLGFWNLSIVRNSKY